MQNSTIYEGPADVAMCNNGCGRQIAIENGDNENTKQCHDCLRRFPTFTKDAIYTIVTISEWMAHTVKRQVRATGIMSNGRPVFKDATKGARKMFTLPTLFAKGTIIFDRTVDLKIDSDITSAPRASGFTSNIMRGNACFNFIGSVDEIKVTMIGNLNPNFDQYDRVLAIPADNAFADDCEVPVFTESETSHAVIMGIRNRITNPKKNI